MGTTEETTVTATLATVAAMAAAMATAVAMVVATAVAMVWTTTKVTEVMEVTDAAVLVTTTGMPATTSTMITTLLTQMLDTEEDTEDVAMDHTPVATATEVATAATVAAMAMATVATTTGGTIKSSTSRDRLYDSPTVLFYKRPSFVSVASCLNHGAEINQKLKEKEIVLEHNCFMRNKRIL
jgi:hypothetical protein